MEQQCKSTTVFKTFFFGVPLVGQRVKNPTRIHEDSGSIPGLSQWVQDPGCRELWCRSQRQLRSHTVWLWCRPADVAPIQPLARELPHPAGVALKNEKQKTKKKKKKKKQRTNLFITDVCPSSLQATQNSGTKDKPKLDSGDTCSEQQ